MRLKATASAGPGAVGLLDFVPRVTPRFQRPEHLAALAALFERAEHEPVRALVTVPPRHGKTELLLHGSAWWLCRHPEQTIGYASHTANIARSKSRQARDYAGVAGLELRDDSSALHEWRTPKGGGMLATGVGGSWTGHGLHLLLVDDPHKNRQEAESSRIRETIHQWFTSTAMTRLEPGGSVIVVHTRWHPDDLIGRLQADRGVPWEMLSLPAIDNDGLALWPEQWPIAKLESKRADVGEYDWASLYQASPRPRGGTVFHDVAFYDALPRGMRIVIGLDLAYTAKTSADYSVAVVLGYAEGKFYLLEVLRQQCAAPDFAAELGKLSARYPGARMVAYIGGTERGVIQLLAGEPHRLRIDARPARADKFVRAQATAAAWNRGDVLLPRDLPWVSAFVSELRAFTGQGDQHDDQVDALVSAYDAATEGAGELGASKSSGILRPLARSRGGF